MRTPAGDPVNAAYGFAGFLLRLLGEGAERPRRVAVAFDGSLTTSFRNQIYPAYKAQRELPPADLEEQQAWCREIAEALGLVTLIDSEYEADDLLATLSRCLRESDPVVPHRIVSSDKDLSQLVGPQVRLGDFARDELYGPSEVLAKFGVRPEQIVDFLALAGDPVDNIPGVRGIGRKTAASLLAELGSLDAALGDLERVAALEIRGARGIARKLGEQRDQALLSRRLARGVSEVDTGLEVHQLIWRGVRPERWAALCERLGFGRLAEQGAALGPSG